MKAEDINLLSFIQGAKQFIVPIYQRQYSWTQKDCRTLLDDILRAGRKDDIQSHFIGSIVYFSDQIPQIGKIPQFYIIDGQQRLTTIMLLLSSLKDITDYNIKNLYLVNNDYQQEQHYKLILTKNDKETFFGLIDGYLPQQHSNLMKENFDFFKNSINDRNVKEILKGIGKLTLIDVALDKDKDNPQLIFESLNATGMSLRQSDLIRNYILMDLQQNKRDEIYRKYLVPIENKFGQNDFPVLFDKFIRNYLTIKTGKIPNKEDVYSKFKEYAYDKDREKLVLDIGKYSEYFINIVRDEADKDLKKCFENIRELKVEVSYPFLMEIYRDYSVQKIGKEDFLEILKYVESYVFRRSICDLGANSLNKIFGSLYSEIDQNNYLESFKSNLILKRGKQRFPNNEEFKGKLMTKDVYNFRNKSYLFRKLGNFNTKEFVNTEQLTIEHIMPQNLSEDWKRELGEKWKEIQGKYLHTLGNLTLTGYNSEMGDRPFEEKKGIGFINSPISLNRYFANLENWNEVEIVKRAEFLANLALNVWTIPTVDEETLSRYTRTNSRKKENYTIENHKNLSLNSPMRPVFDQLRKSILNMAPSIEEEVTKLYVAYKVKTNFVEIVPQSKALKILLDIKIDEIEDPKKFCVDFRNKGRWGTGYIGFRIKDVENVDYTIFLIKQAFEKTTKTV